jgi:hypothetical protein
MVVAAAAQVKHTMVAAVVTALVVGQAVGLLLQTVAPVGLMAIMEGTIILITVLVRAVVVLLVLVAHQFREVQRRVAPVVTELLHL